MKLRELKKGDCFEIDYYDEKTEELILTISGKLIKNSGEYSLVMLQGVEKSSILSSELEARAIA